MKDFDPFLNPHSQKNLVLYTQSMWQGISTLNYEVDRRIGSGGNWAPRTKVLHLPGVSLEFYLYLKTRMYEMTEPTNLTFNRKKVKKVKLTDLSVTNTKLRHETTGFRIETQDDLDCFRRLVGCPFGMVPMIEAPSMKYIKEHGGPRTRRLKNSDLVRAITCNVEDFDNTIELHPQRRAPRPPPPIISSDPSAVSQNTRGRSKKPKVRSEYSGLDVLYTKAENCVSGMCLSLRFVKVQGSSDCVRRAQNAGHVQFSIEEEGDENGACPTNQFARQFAGNAEPQVGDLGWKEKDWCGYKGRVCRVLLVDEEVNSIQLKDDETCAVYTLTYQEAVQNLETM
jgi:hypothetical protein